MFAGWGHRRTAFEHGIDAVAAGNGMKCGAVVLDIVLTKMETAFTALFGNGDVMFTHWFHLRIYYTIHSHYFQLYSTNCQTFLKWI